MFHLKHQTHKETFLRFVALIAALVGYTAYLSHKYSAQDGLGLAFLTWSFFVLCTPIADGGFIVAFPLRILFKIKMLYTQLAVWVIALAGNFAFLEFNHEIYQNTFLTSLLEKVLTTPWPYWTILGLCLVGTLASIFFGDELIDVTAHHDREQFHKHGFKYQILSTLILIGLVTAIYYHLLAHYGIKIPS